MKKQKFMYVVIVAIAAMFFTSCQRYHVKQLLAENGVVQNAVWKSMVTDSVKKDMVRYFIIMGKNNCPEVSEVVIHKQFGIVHIPDSLIKDMSMYHKCFYSNQQMIFEKEVHRISGPTLWKAPQVTFTLKAMDPVNFDQTTIKITTRDATIFWQVIIIVFFLLFIVIVAVNVDGENWGWVMFCSLIVAGMLWLGWYYLPYAASGLMSLVLLVAIIHFFYEPICNLFVKIKVYKAKKNLS